MRTIFSTRDVPAKDGFNYWRDVMCRELLPHDLKRTGDSAFSAGVRMAALFDLTFLEWQTTPAICTRDRRHVGRTNCDEFVLHHLVAGRRPMQQDDTELVLEAGELCLVDPARPYTTAFTEPAKLITVKIPRHELERRFGGAGIVGQTVARRIRPMPGSSAFFLAQFLRSMPERFQEPMDPTAQAMLRDVVIGMSLYTLAALIGAQQAEEASITIMQLEAVIDEKLRDPSLDRGAIAAAVGISVRRANQLLNERGKSLAGLLLERRLAKCSDVLRDPSKQHLPIKTIAYEYGFTEVPHFYKCFKHRYGMTPTEFREQRTNLTSKSS